MSETVHPIANTAAPQPAASTALAPGNLRWLLLGLGLATGMEFYTNDSMNLVLPDITGTHGVSSDEASWILTVYSGSMFLSVPVSIWMAGHFGYKRYLIATIVVFAIASMGCAVSPDLPWMLVCRAIQGFAGGGLYVWWRATIYMLLPKPQRSPVHHRAFRRGPGNEYADFAGHLREKYISPRNAIWQLDRRRVRDRRRAERPGGW
jgi:DHA2 family multidrug resistance protein